MGHAYLTDIVIHVAETLDEFDMRKVECELCDAAGVIAAKHRPGRNHMLMVTYDREETSAVNLLTPLKARGLHAQLIGF